LGTVDDKTVILMRKKTPAKEPEKPQAKKQQERKTPPIGQPALASRPGPRLTAPVIMLAALTLLLVGVSTSLLTVYVFGPKQDVHMADAAAAKIPEEDLAQEIQTVPEADTEAMEAEDVALIRSVTDVGVIELSGDPVVVRQVQTRTRQLMALEHESAKAAATSLGVTGKVMRLTDMLDAAGADLSVGALGAQDDIALFQNSAFAPDAPLDPSASESGTSVLETAPSGTPLRQEFAKLIKSNSNVATELAGFGLDPLKSKDVEAAFGNYFGLKSLRSGDSIAIVGARLETDTAQGQVPVQVSIYREDEWVGTVAMDDDVEAYVRGEDPWYQKNIFAAQILPEADVGGKKQRLLDAIYAVALRNGLPAAVAGETIMMMSRAHDLEQQVEKGDSIAILYTPGPRDTKSGFGRVIYVRVTRATGNLECFVFQPEPGGQFQCISPQGDASVAQAGIVMPVNGTVVAKFGPQDGKSGSEAKMNFGVDLAAPKGSPVIAAAAGQVSALGTEKGLGNVVRLTHPDGSETTYAYLERFANGLKPGGSVGAGQTIGFVGNPPFSREPRLHFELRRQGEPVDPMAEVQASVGQGSAVDVFVKRIIYIESGNRCDAKNPLSTATGLGQFINSTWMTTIAIHRPDLLKLGRARVLALRTNCELARAMTTAFTRDNAAVIRSRGHPVTPGHLYLAHFLGVGGALKVLGSNPNHQIVDVFGEAHVRANPFERGKTIGFLRNWAAQKMAGKTPNKPIKAGKSPSPLPTDTKSAASPQAKPGGKSASPPLQTADSKSVPPSADAVGSEKLVQYATDPKFAELKRNVEILMR
jgi:murein DD-endopeptidase MepM/ murein hydrolase activator NlpD